MLTREDAQQVRWIALRLRTLPPSLYAHGVNGAQPLNYSPDIAMAGVELEEIAGRIEEALRPRSAREIEGQRRPGQFARLLRAVGLGRA